MKKKRILTPLRKWSLAAMVNAFVMLTILFFAPLEIVLGNILEFAVPVEILWWLLLLAALLGAAVLTMLAFLPDRIFLWAEAVLFSGGLCCYVQALLLNGQMGTLTGEGDRYSTATVVLNLLVWLLIAAAVLTAAGIFMKKKISWLHTGLCFASGALVVMQTAVCVMGVLTTDIRAAQGSGGYLSGAGQFSLAGQKNVVLFIIDTCDSKYVEKAREEYPQLLEPFGGFTYFDNATSTHSRTYPSLPYLLTGNVLHLDKPYGECVNEAFENSTFLPRLAQTGCDIRLFTESNYIGQSAKELIANYETAEKRSLRDIRISGLYKQMLKVSLYRESPYLLKWRFAYEKTILNSRCMNLPDACIQEQDLLFYRTMTENGLSVNNDWSAAFRLYHFQGTHPGVHLDETLQENKQPTTTQVLRGDLKIVEEYLNRMEQAGVYESSTVILTADHGSSGGGRNDLDLPGAAGILMLVKPAGAARSEKVKISHAPVCQQDLFATILDAVGADTGDYGRTVFQIGEDEERTRYYYYSALFSDEDGEVALREYAVNGDAKDFSSWSATGKYWDILYSERKVSQHRFSGKTS